MIAIVRVSRSIRGRLPGDLGDDEVQKVFLDGRDRLPKLCHLELPLVVLNEQPGRMAEELSERVNSHKEIVGRDRWFRTEHLPEQRVEPGPPQRAASDLLHRLFAPKSLSHLLGDIGRGFLPRLDERAPNILWQAQARSVLFLLRGGCGSLRVDKGLG